MLDLLNDVVAWMQTLPPGWVYVVIFVVAYLENLIPPIWGDMVIVFGGALAGLGAVSFIPTAALATLGGSLGFMTMYALGWRFDERVWDEGRLSWIPREPVERAQRWVRRWGYGVVLANRFLSGARSVIALTVGSARMPPRPTAVYATMSALVWCTLLVWGGYELGDRWEEVGTYLQVYGKVVTGVLVALAVAWLGRYEWRRRARNQESAK